MFAKFEHFFNSSSAKHILCGAHYSFASKQILFVRVSKIISCAQMCLNKISHDVMESAFQIKEVKGHSLDVHVHFWLGAETSQVSRLGICAVYVKMRSC